MAGTTKTITLKFVGTQNVTATVRQIDGALQVMGKGLTSVNQRTNQTIAGSSQVLKSISRMGRQAIGTFLNVGNSLRLVSQGMMSFGKALTMFITPVVFILLKKAADAAIGFDDALVRVQKTTGLTRVRLRELALGLRDIAVTTSTTAEDLAKIAEEIGKQGVTSVSSILSLVETFNMLTVATDVSADKVASSMGKIANAFGIDLNTEEGAEQILILSNVINRLENNLATTAPEIISGLEKLAQVGSLLEFDPAIGAALIAALTAVGFSAEEAGRGIRNATVKLIQHADEVANVMKNTEKYNTTLEVLAAITEDADQVLLDFIAGMAAGDEKALALAAAIDILGIRGGKSVAGLAGAYDTLQLSMALTADELEKNNSLWLEYQRALLSTKNQMAVLKNNANEIAMVFGDTLLPVLNEVIQTIIPAFRWAAAQFKAMSPLLKKQIVLIALFVAVLGPLVLFLSQIVFALSMVIMGIARFGQVIMSIGSLIVQLTGGMAALKAGIGSVIAFVGGLPGVIAIALAAIIMRFTGLGKAISNFFLNLADKAAAWGQNLIATYGSGMLAAAVNILARVLTAIGNFIGRFLAGSSPPDIGPLSHIDKWGKNVFDAFLGGFANADFSILSQVGSIIEKVLATFAKVEKIGEKKQFIFAMEARKDLAKLIKIFNETGIVAEDVMAAIIKNMGEAGDEVEKLIRLWLDYTRIQKELAALEAQREGVLDLYRQEIQLIAQSNMTAEEKADAIRAAMRGRDEELRLLAKEERELEKQKSIAEEQLDLQRSMIDAMQHQDDLQLRLIDTLSKLGKKFDALEDFAFPDVAFDTGDMEDGVAETYEAIVTLEERIARMSGIWDAFLAGFRGEPGPDINAYLESVMPEELKLQMQAGGTLPDDLQQIVDQMEAMYGYGQKLGGVWESISGWVGKVMDFFAKKEKPKGEEKGILESMGFSAGAIETMTTTWSSIMENAKEIIGPMWEDIALKWQEIWDTLMETEFFQWLVEKIEQISEYMSKVDWQLTWDTIGEVITFVVGIIVASIGWLLSAIVWLFTTGWWLISKIPDAWNWLCDKIAEIIERIATEIVLWILGVALKIATGWENIKTKAAEMWAKIKTAILIAAILIGIMIATKVLEWKKKITDKIEAFKTAGKDLIQGVIDGIRDKISGVVAAVTAIYDAALEVWRKIWNLGSPSKVMFESGQFIMQGAVEGIESMSEEFKMSLVGATDGLLGGGMPLTPAFAGGGINALAGGGTPQITLKFGRDSVRSDKDIEDITDAVERLLAERAEGNMGVGTFGDEI